MEAKATSKGQIVIPAEVRRRFGIKGGTRISIQVDEDGQAIVLKPITRHFIESLRGIDRGKGMLQTLIEERRQDKEREERAFKRQAKKSKIKH
jgi:AbrB family looped-hinge helix DNA binding protein